MILHCLLLAAVLITLCLNIFQGTPFLGTRYSFHAHLFSRPKLEEHSFKSVSFTSTQAQPNIVAAPSTVVHQPTPILVFPPPSFTFMKGSSTSTTQGVVNQVVNMATLTFLMDRYAPLNLPQPMNAMPQKYLKLLPRFSGEYEVTVEQHLSLFCTFA